jgi:hypothetical protein
MFTLVSFRPFVSLAGGRLMRGESEASQEAGAAGALVRGRVVVISRDGPEREVELPPSVVRVLAEVLVHVGRGEPVRIVVDNEEITTGQDAELLGCHVRTWSASSTGGRSRRGRSAAAAVFVWPMCCFTGKSTRHDESVFQSSRQDLTGRRGRG